MDEHALNEIMDMIRERVEETGLSDTLYESYQDGVKLQFKIVIRAGSDCILEIWNTQKNVSYDPIDNVNK